MFQSEKFGILTKMMACSYIKCLETVPKNILPNGGCHEFKPQCRKNIPYMEHLGKKRAVVFRDYRINHEIRIPIDQPGFHEMSQVSFFLAHVRYLPGKLNYQTQLF